MTTKRLLQPAPLRPPPAPYTPPKTSFLDLPAELRIEIYTLALEHVIIHIKPLNTLDGFQPHSLMRVSKQIRSEVIPLMHTLCPIRATVTDFNFDGLLIWLSRIPSDAQENLLRNPGLRIHMSTSGRPPGNAESLRRWLHDRADRCRPQARWTYTGPTPGNKVSNDLRRRIKRMSQPGKQAELRKIARALGVLIEPGEYARGYGHGGLRL